ncbi:hypothetical protein GCM10027521_04740 [Amycolatopsis cihanbeyliensis]
MVHPEPVEGLLAALPHVGRVPAGELATVLGKDRAELGGQHHIVPQHRALPERSAEEFLVGPSAVDVGGVGIYGFTPLGVTPVTFE